MNINEIEIAARRAWPALEEMDTPYGVLRYAQGVNRRTNSMNPVFDRSFDPEAVIHSSEQFFSARLQPSIVRVLAPNNELLAANYLLDVVLSESGYSAEAHTRVMVKELAENDAMPQASSVSQREWLAALCRVKSLAAPVLKVHEQMLIQISDASHFLIRTNREGTPLATAMAVCCAGCMGIFAVATTPEARRQGLAQSLLDELFTWGVGQGARYAYLQVESANDPARRLYEKNGFKEFYSYWYRCKSVCNSFSNPYSNPHDAKEKRS